MSDAKSLLNDVKRFYLLQAERVETYALFEDVLGCDVCRGFVAYLKGAPNYNLEMYKALVGQITTTFNNISKDILSIEKTFKDADMADISRTIRKIQDIEQQKLQTTAELQMIRQQEVDEPSSDLKEPIAELKARLAENISSINEEMENLKYNSEDLYADDG